MSVSVCVCLLGSPVLVYSPFLFLSVSALGPFRFSITHLPPSLPPSSQSLWTTTRHLRLLARRCVTFTSRGRCPPKKRKKEKEEEEEKSRRRRKRIGLCAIDLLWENRKRKRKEEEKEGMHSKRQLQKEGGIDSAMYAGVYP